MTLHTYTHKNQLIAKIDPDGDSYEVFRNIIDNIELIIHPSEYNFENCYWDGSKGFFVKEKLKMFLTYSNWSGTELLIDLPLTSTQERFFEKTAQDILTYLDSSSPTNLN